jgi:hypothetical protein
MVDIKEDTNVDPLSQRPIGGAMIQTRKAGTVTIFARVGADCGKSVLNITSATEAAWAAGNARYNNSIDPGTIRDAGPGADYSKLGCTNCHGSLGTVIQDVQHTAYQIGGYSDQQLIEVFTLGLKPPGIPQRILGYNLWHQFHQWTMTEDEKQGIVIYLRSLEPKPQGETNFPRPDTGTPTRPDTGPRVDTGTGGGNDGSTDTGPGTDTGTGDGATDGATDGSGGDTGTVDTGTGTDTGVVDAGTQD